MLLFDFSFPSWPHTWQEDDVRTPIWTVQFLDQNQTTTTTTTTYGLYLPSAIFWLEIVSCVLLQACVAVLVATGVYHTIIRQPPGGSSLAYMTGFGMYIPLWFLLPYYTIDYLQFDNQLFRFTLLVVIPIVCAFRTSEAMFGFAPPHATTSLRKYMFYYASPLYDTIIAIPKLYAFIRSSAYRYSRCCPPRPMSFFLLESLLSTLLDSFAMIPRRKDIKKHQSDAY
jgi:hypothetical protein